MCGARAHAERKVGFRGQEEREYEASDRVVRGSEHVSMYGMRKRKQIHENARQM